MRAAWLILGLVLAVPGVAAGWGATNEGGVEEDVVGTFVQTRTDPPSGQIFSQTINNTDNFPHYETKETWAVVEITYTAGFITNSNGVWAYTFNAEGGLLQECKFDIRTVNTGTLGGTTVVYPNQGIYCVFPMTLNGTDITFTGSRAVQSGSPSSISQETIAYQIIGYYYLEVDMTNELLDALAVLAPLLAFIIVAVWAERSEEWLVYVLAAVAGLTATITLWGEIASLRLIVVAALLLVIARGAYSYHDMKDENRKLEE